MNFFKKLFGFFKRLATRPGLAEFLERNLALARSIVEDLAAVNSGKAFHTWKDQAWARLKARTQEERGTWLEILINLAYEEVKALANKQKGG